MCRLDSFPKRFAGGPPIPDLSDNFGVQWCIPSSVGGKNSGGRKDTDLISACVHGKQQGTDYYVSQRALPPPDSKSKNEVNKSRNQVEPRTESSLFGRVEASGAALQPPKGHSCARASCLPEGGADEKSWQRVMQAFPGSLQTPRVLTMLMAAAFLALVLYATLSDSPGDCFGPSDPSLAGPCAAAQAFLLPLLAILALWPAALLSKHSERAHAWSPSVVAACWWLLGGVMAAAHSARWVGESGGEARDTESWLIGWQGMGGGVTRHLTHVLAISVTVGTTIGVSSHPSHRLCLAAAASSAPMVALAAFAMVTLVEAPRGSPEWQELGWPVGALVFAAGLAAHAAGCMLSLFTIAPASVLGCTSVQHCLSWVQRQARSRAGEQVEVVWLLTSSSALFAALAASLAGSLAASWASQRVPAAAALAATLVVIALTRFSGYFRTQVAMSALGDALTEDVVNTVMHRTVRSVELRRKKRKLGKTGSMRDGNKTGRKAWEQAIQRMPPPLPYLRTTDVVSVVFTDVVGYTGLSSDLPPRIVLSMLHEYFSKLDALIDEIGVFKYQTVGDSYVVLAGYPQHDPDHAMSALQTAFGMIKVAESVQIPVTNLNPKAVRHLANPSVLETRRTRVSHAPQGELSPIRSAEMPRSPGHHMLPIQESIRDSPTSASPVVGLRVSALPSAHASRPSGPQSPLRGANNVIPPTTDSAAHSPRPSSKADAPHSELPAPGEIPPFSAGNSKAPASRVGAAGDGGAEGGSMGDLSRLRSGSPIAGGRTAAGGSDGVDGPETRPSRDRPATGCEASPPARPAVWRRPVVSSSVHAEARKGVARGAQPGVAKKASRFLEAFSRRSFGPLGRGKNRRAVASSAPREEELVGCLQIRVGIHTGPVAASTLGFRRSCLTLVGDTLNVASRMETASRPGHIRLSNVTYTALPQEVRQHFRVEMLDVKGKGKFLTAISDASEDLEAAL